MNNKTALRLAAAFSAAVCLAFMSSCGSSEDRDLPNKITSLTETTTTTTSSVTTAAPVSETEAETTPAVTSASAAETRVPETRAQTAAATTTAAPVTTAATATTTQATMPRVAEFKIDAGSVDPNYEYPLYVADLSTGRTGYTVSDNGLLTDIYSAPSAASEIIEQADLVSEVTVYAYTQYGGEYWYYVCYNGTYGWCMSGDITYEKPLVEHYYDLQMPVVNYDHTGSTEGVYRVLSDALEVKAAPSDGAELLYVQGAGGTVRAMGESPDAEGWQFIMLDYTYSPNSAAQDADKLSGKYIDKAEENGTLLPGSHSIRYGWVKLSDPYGSTLASSQDFAAKYQERYGTAYQEQLSEARG